MISCRDLFRFLGDYLDEQLGVDMRQEMEAHIAHCRVCTVLVDSTRKTVSIVTEYRSYELPTNVAAKIMARIRAEEDR